MLKSKISAIRIPVVTTDDHSIAPASPLAVAYVACLVGSRFVQPTRSVCNHRCDEKQSSSRYQ